MASNTMNTKYKFVSEPEDGLICLICLEVAEELWQHVDCGRLLCKKCLEELGRDQPCPNCRKQEPLYFQDNRGKRTIRSLSVKCVNVDWNCEWVGTVGTLEEHVATCKFTPLLCPNWCGDELFLSEDIEKHLKRDCPNRNYTCEYCGEKGTYSYIMESHDDVCEMKPISCINEGCTDTMPRQHVEEHVITKCLHMVIPCKYERLGCDVQLKRKDIVAHEENDKLHLHMAIDTTLKLERDLQRALKILDKKHSTLMDGNTFTFKMMQYENKREKNSIFESPPFYCSSPEGYYMNIEVYANGYGATEGTHVAIYNRFLKGENDDKLGWPFTGSITFTLLNQLKDSNHLSSKVIFEIGDNIRVGSGLGCFFPHNKLGYVAKKNTQYLKDDSLYFRVSIDIYNHKPWLKCTNL